MTNQNLKPDVRGFFDPVTATWSYVVYADGHTDKRCAVIDTVLDYDIHSGRTKTDSADRVIDFIQKKVDKLETFYDRMVDGEVFLRLNNEGNENKTVEIKLNVPGQNLFAKEQASSFEAATDLATEALRSQLEKFKAKLRAVRV